jgi:hypothetical protein
MHTNRATVMSLLMARVDASEGLLHVPDEPETGLSPQPRWRCCVCWMNFIGTADRRRRGRPTRRSCEPLDVPPTEVVSFCCHFCARCSASRRRPSKIVASESTRRPFFTSSSPRKKAWAI